MERPRSKNEEADQEAFTNSVINVEKLRKLPRFNHQRLLEPIGYMPPAEAEKNYYRQQAEKATVEV